MLPREMVDSAFLNAPKSGQDMLMGLRMGKMRRSGGFPDMEGFKLSHHVVLSCLELKHKAACVTCQLEINYSAVVGTCIRAGEGKGTPN